MLIQNTPVTTIICILGMHRSGTSAVMRLLNLLGAELGSPLLAPQAEINAGGFWEHAEVVALNERLLTELGQRWFDVCPIPDNSWEHPALNSLRDAAQVLLLRQFQGKPLVAIKDPRLCRTLPLWLQAIAALGWRITVVLVTRAPAEIAASLALRDGFAISSGRLLSCWYLRDAEYHSRGLARGVLAYTELLENWRGAATRIAHALNINWPVNLDDAVTTVPAAICPERRRQRAGANDLPDDLAARLHTLLHLPLLDTMALDTLYAELAQQCNGESNRALIDSNQQLIATRQELFALGALHQHAQNVVAERDQQLNEAQQELARIGALHSHAQQVVAERDQQLAALRQRGIWQRLLKGC